uniref:HNH endonuclease family protein n=1 Tax=Treponema pectinovorum TaxID=164 RepID=UPI001C9C992A
FNKEMKEKVPKYENIEKNISELWYTTGKENDKPIILYILKKIERFLLKNNELDILIVSIEHINSQVNNNKFSGKIGNLLPLDVTLNSDIGSKPLKEKIKSYRDSNLNTVKKFCSDYMQYGDKKDWTEEDVNKRTQFLSKLLYNDICSNVTQ